MSHPIHQSPIHRPKNIPDLIRAAIAAIAHAQLPDGSFTSYSSLSRDDFSDAIPRRTTFFTSNILICLGRIRSCPNANRDYPELTPIATQAAAFLLNEQHTTGAWNYWGRVATAAGAPPYPDDLDDTFAALAGLWLYNRTIVDERMLAAMVKLLTAAEADEGGPYRTWIVSPSGDAAADAIWRDVDIVVNGTVGYFLALVGIHLPKLERFLGNVVDDAASGAAGLSSPYYPTPIHIAYFLARFYGTRKYSPNQFPVDPDFLRARGIIPAQINASQSVAPFSILEWAMAISSMVDLGFSDAFPRTAVAVFGAAARDANWPASAFCIDPARDGKTCYGGASALTAAFCAEALARYLAADGDENGGNGKTGSAIVVPPRMPFSPDTSSHRLRHAKIHERIRGAARADCRALAPELAITALAQIDRMQDEKITSAIYDFYDLLPVDTRQADAATNIGEATLDSLALANLYGWMAYTIYDDILDDECGENGEKSSAERLPAANFFARRLADIYKELDATAAPSIWKIFIETMGTIDAANAWEQAHCRIAIADGVPQIDLDRLPDFGDYATLADRSVGHALGPLAILVSLGYAVDSSLYRETLASFHHYLIARQLHDDAHDWADDLRRGRVTSVGAMVLREFDSEATGKIPQLELLESFFWRETINRVVSLILEHITAARATSAEAFSEPSFLEPALASLESSARRTLVERDRMLTFLAAYENTT